MPVVVPFADTKQETELLAERLRGVVRDHIGRHPTTLAELIGVLEAIKLDVYHNDGDV
jgi:hypothetical protein